MAVRASQPAAESDDAQQATTLEQETTLVRGFKLLAITTFAAAIANQSNAAIQPNYFRDVIGIDGAQNGYLIALREVPGFLLIFVAAILLRLGLARATSVSLLIMGIGYVLFAFTDTAWQLVIPTLVASVGFHSWLQLQPALGLSIARRGHEGSTLGRLNSIGFLGSLIALTSIFLLLLGVEHFKGDLREYQEPFLRGLFIFAGIAGIIGAVAIFRFPDGHKKRGSREAAPNIVWRREYRLYYLLSFLDGSRQQIYFAFAPFVLVEEFNVDAKTFTLLLVISALINWRTGARVGRMVDRYGEKRFLTVAYSLHFVVLLGFALSQNVWMLYVFYLGYLWLFLFYVGTTTYLKKIARPSDVPASLAMGVSLAHLTAIIVPIVGAALWGILGYQFPFLLGTVFCLISLYLTQKIDIPSQRIDGAPV